MCCTKSKPERTEKNAIIHSVDLYLTLYIHTPFVQSPLKGTLHKTHRKTVKRKYYFHSIKLRKIPMKPMHKRNGKGRKEEKN